MATRPAPFSTKVTSADPVIAASSMTLVTSIATVVVTEPSVSVAVTVTS